MNNVKQVSRITDLTPDSDNANKGTERGYYILDDSLVECGAGRSILVDKDGVVIAGNKTLQAAADKDFPVKVIQTDGSELVVVQRTDLALSGNGDDQRRARRLALYDNRSSEVGLEWDGAVLEALADEDETILDGLFFEDELDELVEMALLEDDIDAALSQEYGASERALGDRKKQIKPVLYADDVTDFERAIAMTGLKNRGEAIMEICRAYLRDGLTA